MAVKAISKPISHESKGERAELTAFALLAEELVRIISIFACGRENQSSTFEREYRSLRGVCTSFRDALDDDLLNNRKLELYIRRTFPSLHGDRALYAAAQTNMLDVLESREFSAVERADLFDQGASVFSRPTGDEGFFASGIRGRGHNTTTNWVVREFSNGKEQFRSNASSFYDNKAQILERRWFQASGKNLHWITVQGLTLPESQGETLGEITRGNYETFAVSEFFLAYGKFSVKVNVRGLHSGKTKTFTGFDYSMHMHMESSIFQHQLFQKFCNFESYTYVKGFTQVFDLRSDPESVKPIIIPNTFCGNMARVNNKEILIRTTLFGSDGQISGEALQIFDLSFNLIRSLTIDSRDKLGSHWTFLNGSNLLLVGGRALVLGSSAVSLYNLDNGKRQEILVAGGSEFFTGFQIFDGVLRAYRTRTTSNIGVAPIDINLNLSVSERESIRKVQQQVRLEKEQKESEHAAQQAQLETARQARLQQEHKESEHAAEQALPDPITAQPVVPAHINSQPPVAPPAAPAQPLPAPQQSFWDSALECLTNLFNWIRSLCQ
jgi:hypothetical protein